MELGNYSIGASFVAGIVSFLSPCILPLIPIYLSYITGISVEQLQLEEKNIKKNLFLSIFFVAGFTFIFVLMGASATVIGSYLIRNQKILKILGGIIIIIFGFHLMGIFKIKKFYTEKRVIIKKTKISYVGAFIFGMAFSAGWTPCVGPILSSILILAANEETILNGIILLFFYSIGIGIPFILTSLLLNKFLQIFDRIKKHYKKIETVSGCLLIIIGILLILDKFTF